MPLLTDSAASHPPALVRARTVIVCLALFLEGMSSSSINVQIAAVEKDFAPGPVELQLIAGVFLISYAGLLPLAGQLVDRSNRRTLFQTGVVLFGLGSLACAMAPAAPFLVLGRFAQGAGAALSAPAALALITTGLPVGAARNRAVTTYGAMGAVGFSTGLVVPGAMVTALGWRSSFLVLVPIVMLVVAATWRIPTSVAQRSGRLDLPGALLLTLALALALSLVSGVGSLSVAVLGAGAIVLAGLVAALVRRGGVGGIPRSTFGRPRVLGAGLGLAAVFAGVLSSMFVLSLELQTGDGMDAYEVGLLILPQPLAFSAASRAGAAAVGRHGPGRTLAAGMLLIVSSLVLLATITVGPPQARTLIAMALIGVGMALSFPAASIAAVDATPEALRGTTAGLLTTAQNVGGALGLAVVTALDLVPRDRGDAAAPGLLVAAALIVGGGLAAAAAARTRASEGALA
ncbi:MFS transporter [Nocardioides jensenii]|uniref:MFS transporter n=1 Tax=Nocardioides jensenii TaxID=1843 RepID=UPI0008346EF8|nr:MFS transporter [Nocardioides jensenii]